MPSISAITYLISLVFLLASSCSGDNVPGQTVLGTDSRRPVYLIAHRLLENKAIPQALSDGANAFEIDVAPSNGIWYAWHADKFTPGDKPKDTIDELFDAVATHRRNGKPITFVWLDIKNAGDCSSVGKGCIIELQRMAQKKLEPVGVRVLYGFDVDDADSDAWMRVARSLSANEAVGVNARAQHAIDIFSRDHNKAMIPAHQRVMSFGFSFLSLPKVRECHNDRRNWGKYAGVCYELSVAAKERDRAKPRRPRLGRVFGWTITAAEENSEVTENLLGFAKVDGLIYGEVLSEYRDSKSNRIAVEEMKKWLRNNSKTHRPADRDDSPW
ncbi:uncharacterized protein LDX57_011618 [Aspergillus melleus]|uniref:uncharacterized protein n=1 Tax=Aspergillus melleus TaxID=138277 RepID=UPI001E8E6B15|nr:uncharacterized protein LDX57_011618 [Aspergillus melleus]KAH8433982.1 hypothetical protein LDX57_011618 [Aspergillus melleus]